MSVVKAVLQTLTSLRYDPVYSSNNENAVTAVEPENLETAEKIRAFTSLPTLALSMGPEDTRSTLIPLLLDVVNRSIENGDDEVLMIIAQKLEFFLPLVGGSEHIEPVIEILNLILCKVEEIVVANAAGNSLIALIPQLPSAIISNSILAIIRKTMEDDLFCSSRKVSTGIIIACYPHVNAQVQSELKYRLIHLADNDEEVPMNRAAAVNQLVPLIKLVGLEIKGEMNTLLNSLVSDSQRVVRAACIAPLIELGHLCIDLSEFENFVLHSFEKLAEDTNRDTKRSIAQHINDLQQLVVKFKATPAKPIHQIMLNLLEDNEVETRRVAASQIEGFCLASPSSVLSETLLPRLREHLAVEREERVRAELVNCAVKLLPNLKREECLPLVQNILTFLNESSSQTKQYVFEYFSQLVAMLPINDVQLTLLPSLLRLWQDKNWRVRLGVVQSVPCLFDTLPEQCLKETVLPASLAWLRDPTWTVRECSCRSLARLLRACPAAAKDALMGTHITTAAKVAAQLSTPLAPSNTTANNAANDSNNASDGANNGQNAGGTDVNDNKANTAQSNATSVASLTQTAASGGLKALATDPNYHLRQVYVLAIQTLWGPGIPDEVPYSASGEGPDVRLINPSHHTMHNHISSSTSSGVPSKCSSPPNMPPSYFNSSLTQLLSLMEKDPVPNVRFCAAQAVFIVSSHIDKRIAQKEVVPILKKIISEDGDLDVKYFAQETLSVFSN